MRDLVFCGHKDYLTKGGRRRMISAFPISVSPSFPGVHEVCRGHREECSLRGAGILCRLPRLH